MKSFCFGFFLGVVLTGFAAAAILFTGPRIQKGHGFPIPRTLTVGGIQVALGTTNSNAVIIKRGSDSLMLTPPAHEVYDEPAASSDGRTLFFLVRKELEFGYEYGGILRVELTTNALSTARISRLLTKREAEALLRPDGGVLESFNASSTGDRLLLNTFQRERVLDDPSGSSWTSRQVPMWYDVKSNVVYKPMP